MRTVALIVLGLVAANAVFTTRKASDPNANVFAELQDIEENEMGKKLLDTIALQMKNMAPLADIAKMLQSLRENLVLQQQEADMKHAADEVDCQTEIAGYNRRIDFASNEIEEATTEINGLTNQVSQLTAEIENKANQLRILDEQEQILRDTREQEAADFKVRIVQTKEVIEALNVIAAKLGSIEPEGDARAVLLELHKMGNSNPIAALVSLASAFSKDRLDAV
jgi:cysteinyl-tRNA synthetase